MIRVFSQRRMHKLLDLCLRLFHSRVGQTLFLVQCSLISMRIARRSSEQERSRSQQNQPTNQPNVERLIGPETTEAEFRAALLGFVRNQHDRPKAKEADSLRLSEFPTPETYRAWKTATREFRAASDRPDAAFTWVNKVSADPYVQGATSCFGQSCPWTSSSSHV